MNQQVSEAELRERLVELRQEHRDLDAAIDEMTRQGVKDQLQMVRLKKRKLQLKDAIARLESQLIPDLDA
jgi:hypothetical protein